MISGFNRGAKRIFLIFIFFSVDILSAQNVADFLKKEGADAGFSPFVRIGIKERISSFELEGDAQIELNNTVSGSIQGKYFVSAAGKTAIKVGDELYFSDAIKFIPKFSFLSVGKKIFRGSIEVHNKNGLLVVVNDLDLDDYVKGVINKEIIPSWPPEAKKVQAVLARTYAVYQKIFSPKNSLYDMAPTVIDQVYGGLGKEDLSANDAVSETRGEILTYGNMPAQIFFHSTCGGATASGSEVWGKETPYLQSVPCLYCSKSKLYRWRRALPEAGVLKSLKKSGVKIENIESIEVLRTARRVKFVLINGSIKIPANTFRSYLGYSVIWSNDFSAEKKDSELVFSGRGGGHGVGCCQWGMAEMAKDGRKYEEILKYYLKGTVIKKIY